MVRSSVGRAFVLVRENEVLAESLGISAFRYCMIAFVSGAALAGAEQRPAVGREGHAARALAHRDGSDLAPRRQRMTDAWIAFRDFVADGEAALQESPFFALPTEQGGFSAFVNGLLDRVAGG